MSARRLALLVPTLFTATAAAGPVVVAHSGYLLTAADQPASGSLAMRFRLYASPTGGSAAWDGGACAVQVAEGYFTVALGGDCGSGLDSGLFAATAWLSTEVAGVELAPRTRLEPSVASVELASLRGALGTVGTVNSSGNPVHWTQLKGVPAGLADGTDDLGAAAAGGGLVLGGGAYSLATDAASLAKVSGGALTHGGTAILASVPLQVSGNVVVGVGARFEGSGAGLTHLGDALVGASGATLEDTLASLSATNADANRILGVTVDATAIGDGKVLRYDAASNKLVYATVSAGGGGVPATVPPTISWSSDTETGNSKCAQAKGVCTQARDASNNVVSCSAQIGIGSASCVADASFNESVAWASDTETGHSMCSSVQATCVQAYDSVGGSVACSTQSGSGTAACLKAPLTQGFDAYVAWSDTSKSGTFACGAIGKVCVQAYDSVGADAACGSNGNPGRARCRTPTATDPWDRFVTWPGTASSGNVMCARQQAECVDVLHVGTAIGGCTCGSNCSGGGYQMLARCKTRPAGSWDFAVEWPGTAQSGEASCTVAGGVCVGVVHQGTAGGGCPCGTNCSGGGYEMLAKCRNRTASDAWDKVVTWPGNPTSGTVQCALNRAECVEVWHDGTAGGACPCGSLCSGSGYRMAARCRSITAGDPWDDFATWTNSTAYGNVECAKRGAECVDVPHAGTAAGVCPCNAACGGSGYTMVARCHKATIAAQGWNTPVQWSNQSTTGNAQCAAIGGVCVSAVDAVGTTRTCTDAFGGGSSGLAKCRLP